MVKYALRELKSNKMLSIICIVQCYITIIIVILSSLLFFRKFNDYKPAMKYMEHDGVLVNVYDIRNYDSDKSKGMGINDSTILEKRMRNVNICAAYEVKASLGINLDTEYIDTVEDALNITAYDDEIIEGFKPDIDKGKWLKVNDNRGDMLYAVVLQWDNKYNVGDVIELKYTVSKTLKKPIKVKIIGILNPHSNVINIVFNNKKADYRLAFNSFDNIHEDLDKLALKNTGVYGFMKYNFFIAKGNMDNVNKKYIDNNFDVVKNKVKVPLDCNIHGVTQIRYKKNITKKEIKYNINYIYNYFEFDTCRELSEIKKQTWEYILYNVKPILPYAVGSGCFTIFSFVTMYELIKLKNRKKYLIYSYVGLSKRKIKEIQIEYILLIIIVSSVIVAVSIIMLKNTGVLGFI